jgi:hypothetical protein
MRSAVQPPEDRVPLRRGRKIGCADFWTPEVLLCEQISLFFLFLMLRGSNMRVRGKEICDNYMKMNFLKMVKLTYQRLRDKNICFFTDWIFSMPYSPPREGRM